MGNKYICMLCRKNKQKASRMRSQKHNGKRSQKRNWNNQECTAQAAYL